MQEREGKRRGFMIDPVLRQSVISKARQGFDRLFRTLEGANKSGRAEIVEPDYAPGRRSEGGETDAARKGGVGEAVRAMLNELDRDAIRMSKQRERTGWGDG